MGQPEKKAVNRRDGTLYCEQYRLGDMWHREDGPAFIRIRRDGTVFSELYWLDDKPYSKKSYDLVIKEAKEMDILDYEETKGFVK